MEHCQFIGEYRICGRFSIYNQRANVRDKMHIIWFRIYRECVYMLVLIEFNVGHAK